MQCLFCLKSRPRKARNPGPSPSPIAAPETGARDLDLTNESTATTAVNADAAIHGQEGNQPANQPQQHGSIDEPRPVTPVRVEKDPQPPASPPSVSEKIWDTAYDGIKEAEPSLVRAYEKIISLELGRDGGNDENKTQAEDNIPADNAVKNVVESDPGRRRQQMAFLVKRRQDSAGGRGLAMAVTLRGIGILEKFKLAIADALQAYPPAGLAFAGVCLIAEVCQTCCTLLLAFPGTIPDESVASYDKHQRQHPEPGRPRVRRQEAQVVPRPLGASAS